MPHFNRRFAHIAAFLAATSLTGLFIPADHVAQAQTRSLGRNLSAETPANDLPADSLSDLSSSARPANNATELPEAPEPQSGNDSQASGSKAIAIPPRLPRFAAPPRAPLYNKYIEAGQTAQPLVGFQHKLTFGAAQIISPYFLLAAVSSAGYEHLTNGSPNYGTDSGAYGARIGAAAIRISSDSILTDGLMPALFHQDPRFYVMGKGHSVPARGVHAVMRVFITRSDTGVHQANYSLFAGHAAVAALENAYYPTSNQGFGETAASFGESLSGTALSNTIREFFPDLLHLAHLE